jgi:hypothetical protein
MQDQEQIDREHDGRCRRCDPCVTSIRAGTHDVAASRQGQQSDHRHRQYEAEHDLAENGRLGEVNRDCKRRRHRDVCRDNRNGLSRRLRLRVFRVVRENIANPDNRQRGPTLLHVRKVRACRRCFASGISGVAGEANICATPLLDVQDQGQDYRPPKQGECNGPKDGRA